MHTSPYRNRLLSVLSPGAMELLTPYLSVVDLPVRSSLYKPEQVPRHAFFMTSGLASVVTPMLDGGTAEVEVIGHEGLVGSFHLLGSAAVPTECFVQLEGSALRISFPEMQRAYRSSDEIRERVLEFIQEQALTVSQMAGCNRLHEAEARLARWLLMARDRTESDTINLTQEFLAEMLGTQRTTVSTVAGVLQRSGFIEYRQGIVKIKDRESLEASACDCYRIARQLYSNLYKRPIA